VGEREVAGREIGEREGKGKRRRPPSSLSLVRLLPDTKASAHGPTTVPRRCPVLRRGVYHRKVWHTFLLSLDIIYVVVAVVVT
jgi:hypothetical protein